jgi:predicted amino acid racemase
MFLEATTQQNPDLIGFAARLHHDLAIAPNTYVIDADTVAANAARTAYAGRVNGIALNVMTKQFGRNPRIAQLICDAGLDRFVAVDVDEARVLWRAGLRVAHVGHLVGTAAYDAEEVVAHRPDAITVYNLTQARRIDAATRSQPGGQRIFLRMYDPKAQYHPCQHGGFVIDQLDATLAEFASLRGVTVAGVTTHPCLDYDYDTGEGGATPKLALLRAAAQMIAARFGQPVEVNAPGVTCIATMPLLRSEGASTAEPGSSLTGSTPLNAFGVQPEVPAVVYVSEVSHTFGEHVYTFGGGFYPRGHVQGALLGRDGKMPSTYLAAVSNPAEAIDYHGELANPGDADVQVGDTAIYAFRNQIFVTRARVAVVEGLQDGRARVTGVYDSLGQPLAGR